MNPLLLTYDGKVRHHLVFTPGRSRTFHAQVPREFEDRIAVLYLGQVIPGEDGEPISDRDSFNTDWRGGSIVVSGLWKKADK
jgi:hypothetical protein